MMTGMGGFNAPLMLAAGNAAKPNRGSKTRGGYSQYTTYYPQGSWPDHRMGPGYYPPTGYGLPIPMMGRHMGMDPGANMDFLADQFQGILYKNINKFHVDLSVHFWLVSSKTKYNNKLYIGLYLL